MKIWGGDGPCAAQPRGTTPRCAQMHTSFLEIGSCEETVVMPNEDLKSRFITFENGKRYVKSD